VLTDSCPSLPTGAEFLPGEARCQGPSTEGRGVDDLASFLIGAGFCRGRSESRWSARSVARTYDLDCDLCAALGCPARGGRPVHWCRRGDRRVRYGGWPGWWRVRGNGGAGSGPRRCAIALEAAGQAAPPATARLPRSGRLRRGTLPIVQHTSRVLPVHTARVWPGPVGPARRRRALEGVGKVVTATRAG
jgi:hypothetical protein